FRHALCATLPQSVHYFWQCLLPVVPRISTISAPPCSICAGSGEDVFGKDDGDDTAWEDAAQGERLALRSGPRAHRAGGGGKVEQGRQGDTEGAGPRAHG